MTARNGDILNRWEVRHIYEQFLRDRITQLRMQRNISESQMSLELGHSRGYIQNISRGKSLPSVEGLFEICEYFEISPKEFFDEALEQPALISEAMRGLGQLTDADQLLILNHINRLRNDLSK